MGNAVETQAKAPGKKVPGRPFQPGHAGGPGRPKKTPELRALEAMAAKQVEVACTKLVGLAVERVVQILTNGDDATAWRCAESFIARSIGPVPSANYIQANVNSTPGSDHHVASADEIKATILGYAARITQQEATG